MRWMMVWLAINVGLKRIECQDGYIAGTQHLVMIVRMMLFAAQNEKPQPGMMPNWGFSFCYHSRPYEVREDLYPRPVSY